MEKTNEKKPNGQLHQSNSEGLLKTREDFTRLRFKLIIGVLSCFIIPQLLFSAYFHFQFTSTLQKTEKFNLEALAKSQRNTIDLFLLERKMNIRNLFYNRSDSFNSFRETMIYDLQKLTQISDAFVDVGFLNEKGIQTGYSGPFPELLGKNYQEEEWFRTLAKSTKDYVITDIYLGFRNTPHFTIAVKQTIEGKMNIIRATIDPDKFYMFLRSISKGKEVETTLINNRGTYQIVDPHKGNLLEKSSYMPSLKVESGVTELSGKNGIVITAHAWLKETPWTLIVSQPLRLVHAEMYKTRAIMIISLILIIILFSTGTWFVISKLVKRAQVIVENSHSLQSQLIHATKLASVGELATGIAHEINNPLAIITSTSGVVRDLLNPEFNLDASPENIYKELDIIEAAAFRASGITRQLLDFGRKNKPQRIVCNINDILDKTTQGVKKLQFNVANIELIKNYAPALPDVSVDPNQIGQVFLNLINNAGDAISGQGTITISTDLKDEYVRVMVQDTGQGIKPEQIEEIFNPFFTTKDPGKGTGLGLSISLSIIDAMNGSLEVQSLPGKGSLFTVSLPVDTSVKGKEQEVRRKNENSIG
ncbi:MAG: ATP-binding protein [Thermodesulfobacteriota bacterium]|nr:ATP-binding protein [Thermodesulfobacteriota bacterium]